MKEWKSEITIFFPLPFSVPFLSGCVVSLPGHVPGSLSFLSRMCSYVSCSGRGYRYTFVIELVSFSPGHRRAVWVVCYFIAASMKHAFFLPGHFPMQFLSLWRNPTLRWCVQSRWISEKLAFSRKEGMQRSTSLPILLSLYLKSAGSGCLLV